MNKISKKVLAIILCLSFLLSVAIGVPVSASDDTSARDALFSAWGNLVYEDYTPLARAKSEGTAPDIQLLSSVPDDIGLTAQQEALFGSTIVKFTGTGSVWTKVDEDIAMDIYYGNTSFETSKVAIYTTFDQIELHALLGNNYNLPSGWNILNKGFTMLELKDLFGLINGLINGTIDVGGNSLSIVSDYVSGGNGNIYVGPVMGVNYAKETVPAEVKTLNSADLFDYVMNNVNLDKYIDGVEEFEAALIDVYGDVNPDAAALIKAWGGLGTEVVETVSYPDVNATGNATVKPISEFPSDLGLSAEQIASFGSHFVTLTTVGDEIYDKSFDVDFSKYTSLSVSLYNKGYSDNGTVKYTDSNNASGYLINYGYNDPKYYSVSADALKGKTISNIRWKYSSSDDNSPETIYIGSIIGHTVAYASLPEDILTWSNEELIIEALKVNTSEYDVGVEAFKSVINKMLAIDPDAEALIDAWGNLVGEEYVTIAYPGGVAAGSPTLCETSALTGLSDEQKAMMGSHYWQMNSNADKVYGITWENQDNFSQYDSVFYVIYGTAGAVCTQINGGAEIYTSANSFAKIAVTPTTSWWSLQHWSYDWYAPIYIGSVVGHKTVNVTVDPEVYTWSIEKLYEEASKVDTSKYLEGVEEFNAALNALYSKVHPEAASVISAWATLEKEEYVTIAYPGGVAAGSPTLGETSALTGLSDEQKAMMGSHYWAMNAYGDKVQSIEWVDINSIGKCDSYFFAIYAPGGGYKGQIYTQFNGGGDIYTAANGFVTVNVTPSSNWWSILQQCTENYGTIYVGSVVGRRTVNATVPAEVYSMTEKELYDYVVANVNTSNYTAGVEEFNAALNALNLKTHPEAAAVISAWGNLVGEEYVTIAYPGGVAAGSPTLGETSALTGLSDEQKAMMGSHYWAMNAYGDKVQGINWVDQNSIGKCDSYFFVIYAPGGGYKGQIYTQFNGSGDIYTGANGFVKVNVTPSSNWWSILQMCTENYGTIYVGSVVGRRTVNATVPAEVYSMTEKELYDYVVANVNTSNYTAGVEEFNAALAELKEVTKVIVNGNFEKGSVIGWNGDIAIDNTVANGTYSAKINGTANYSANLKENETYLVTFKAYREDVANNFGFSVVSGDLEVLYTTTSEFTSDVTGEFVEFKAVIKSNVNTAEFTIATKGTVWVDDFAVTEYEAKGDSNLDGVIDIIDLVRIKKYALQILINNKPAADINSDGLVDSADIVALRKLIMSI